MILRIVKIFAGLLLVFAFMFETSSCRKQEDFFKDSSAKVGFSTDTLSFDTVFTTQGSATRLVKVFNPYDQPVMLSKVYLENQAASKFNLNVDGIPGRQVENVEIESKDSIYIFVEVTINPDDPISISPFVVEENLLVEINGNTQKVILQAWGQNANYLPNNTNSNGLAITSCALGSLSWNDPKPYVIFGVLFIDSCTVNIPAGTRIYVHGGIANNDFGKYSDGIIYVLPNGRLNIQGTKEQPVIIQGDRLEKEFKDVPGQWAGIRFAPGSKNNIIRYAEIKNSIVGVRADSASQVKVYNSKIYNTSSSGIIAEHCTFVAENCLIYNNGGNAFQSEFGGDLFIRYCTMASYGNNQTALKLSNTRCLDQFCNTAITYPLSADVSNCIIMGSQEDELSFVNRSMNVNDLKINMKNNIVRVKEFIKPNAYPDFFDKTCLSCINAKSSDKLFKDIGKQMYQLDTLSIAEQKAVPIPMITKDIDDADRDPVTPDIGCYEYQY